MTASLLLFISCTAAYAIDYKNKPEPWQKVRNAFIVSRSLSCLYAHKNDSDEVRRACTKRILDDFDTCEKKAGDDHNALQECLDSLGRQQ